MTEKNHCPSHPNPYCPLNTGEGICELCGYDFTMNYLDRDQQQTAWNAAKYKGEKAGSQDAQKEITRLKAQILELEREKKAARTAASELPAEVEYLKKEMAALTRVEVKPTIHIETFAFMEFVRIEEGDFLMGSPASEAGRLDIEYRHRVSVGSYWLGIHAVTNAQYRLFKPDHDSGSYKGESLNEDTQPVVNVSWEDATAFAEWLSGKAGVESRLPTEAEWEYAARAGTTTAYYTGEDINSKQANYDKYASKATKLVYPKKTLPVGSFPPNPWGLYDLHGNVWEWTCSIFDRGYSGAELTCARKSDAGNRAVRGGAWIREPGSLRSAYRFYMAPDARVNSLGFRLLMKDPPRNVSDFTFKEEV